MGDLVVILISCIISEIIFLTLIKAFNLKVDKIFGPIRKKTAKTKNKSTYKFITVFVGVAVVFTLRQYVEVSNILFGVVIGLVCSFTDLCFE